MYLPQITTLNSVMSCYSSYKIICAFSNTNALHIILYNSRFALVHKTWESVYLHDNCQDTTHLVSQGPNYMYMYAFTEFRNRPVHLAFRIHLFSFFFS